MNFPLVDPDSRFAVVGDLRLHFKRSGSGRALLLLHGSASSIHGFERVAARLSTSFDVITLDLPGFGFTGPRPDRDYRVSTYVDTVAGFMSELGLERFSVVGNSLGGNIGWNLALAVPARVESLVLINATGYPEKSLPMGIRLARNPILRPLLRRGLPRRATERNLRALVGRPSMVDEAMVDRVHAMMSLPGNRSAFVDFANTDQEDRSHLIPRVAVPTLVLRSVSVDGQHFGRDIPGAVEVSHPTGGHLLPEEDPEWVVARIRDFLGGNPDPHSDRTRQDGSRP
ncbi:alpha/beta fold hydrolase [Nocardioides luteus]|uniref:Alpha/beta hydrolase n=1 Tax=Nocardioides luteus TaxID=1844 RepID=A0A1J4N7B9_9ACTN|nr:alpha/beta hydrolase [Nocardioides luteus]OIJ26377.1 alpha/beta hydrolase [Nocardioides luteus]